MDPPQVNVAAYVGAGEGGHRAIPEVFTPLFTNPGYTRKSTLLFPSQ